MADRWEVVRIYGDERPHVRSEHKSVELAEAAFAKATKDDALYAVDVNYLPGGQWLAFEPLFGIANGYQWIAHDGCPVYAEQRLNEGW